MPICTGSTWAQSKSDKERFSKADQERKIMQVTPRPLTAETRCCGISNRAILPTVSERRLPVSGLTRLRQLSGNPT